MATFADLTDAAEFAQLTGNENPAAHVENPAAPTVESPNGERTRTLEHVFSIRWTEVPTMPKRHFWDKYAGEIVRRICRQVRHAEATLGRKLVFRRFPLPTNTANRRVLTFDRDGVFVGAVLRDVDHVIGKNPDGSDRLSRVLEVTMRAVIALAPNEN